MSATLSLPWLLLATPQMNDPGFARTVILMMEHDQRGSLGFILNRPVRLPLARLVVVDGLAIPDDVPAWYGGPVATESGLVLSWRPGEAPGGVAVSGHESALRTMLTKGPSADLAYPDRFVVGYSGWGGGQLDAELRQGVWIQRPLDLGLAFGTPATELWQVALASIGVSRHATVVPPSEEYLN